LGDLQDVSVASKNETKVAPYEHWPVVQATLQSFSAFTKVRSGKIRKKEESISEINKMEYKAGRGERNGRDKEGQERDGRSWKEEQNYATFDQGVAFIHRVVYDRHYPH
jgi:hypothetical protein